MAYTIKTYNNTTITTLQDGTVDTTLDIKLIGKNYAGYGDAQNENFVYLLENFAGTSEPPHKIKGQIWYDDGLKKLKFFDGNRFRTTGGAEVVSANQTKPVGLSEGDFVWDSANQQLFAYVADTNIAPDHYVLVGPQSKSSSKTEMRSMTVGDTLSVTHDIIVAYISNTPEYIISNETFTLPTGNPVSNSFTTIVPGINYKNQVDARFIGVASNSLQLNGKADTAFIQKVGAEFDASVVFANDGFLVGKGASNKLSVFLTTENNTTIPTLKSSGAMIYFKTTTGVPAVETLAIKISGTNILPGTQQASNIGASGSEFGTVFATTFSGTATQSVKIQVDTTSYLTGSVNASGNTIAARDTNGNINAMLFNGTATKAYYADLAEKYLADANYEVGTVVVVGGEKEVTASTFGKRALGTVSENPAYMMNSGLVGGTYIALKGRVPVKVSGIVRKGDRLVAGDNGTAVVAQQAADTFAIALESNEEVGVKLIEAVIL